MSLNGSGVFVVNSAGQPVVANTLIEAAVFNAFTADVATALSTAVYKDGQQTITANIPMSGFRFTGLGAAATRTDSVRGGDVQDSGMLWGGTAGGTADALTLTLTPAITAYVAGQRFIFKSGAAANTGAATMQINGIATPGAIQLNGSALSAGQIEANRWYEVLVSSTGPTVFQLNKFEMTSLAAYLPLAGGTMTGALNGSFQTIANHATTADIWAKDTTFFNSAVTVTAIPNSPQAGSMRWLQPANGTVYTHDGGNINILNGGSNYTTVTNDWILVRSKSTTLNDLIIFRANGQPLALPSATDSVTGAVELATSAEIKTGTDTGRVPTPAGILAAMGFTAYVQTADQAHPGSGGLITVAHGLPRAPVLMQMLAKNVTGEFNWSTGETFVMPNAMGDSGYGATLFADATNVYARFSNLGANANTRVMNKTTGALATMTDANWSFFIRAWA